MKFKDFAAAVSAILVFSSCAGSLPEKVDFPHYFYRSSTTQEIVSIERSDSVTVFSMKSFFRPADWIAMSGGTHLCAGGKDYALTGAEGIVPDEHLFMDAEGNAEYKLFFEALPDDVSSVDFMEGDFEGAFVFLDIDLTGKDAGLRKKVKPRNRVEPLSLSMTSGQTTVIVAAAELRKRIDFTPSAVPIAPFPAGPSELEPSVDEDGNLVYSFQQFGPAEFCISGTAVDCLTKPGETAYIYPDFSARDKTVDRFGLDEPVDCGLYDCAYGNIMDAAVSKYNLISMSAPYIADPKGPENYMKEIRSAYEEKLEAASTDPALDPVRRHFAELSLKGDVAMLINSAQGIIGLEEYPHFSDEDIEWLKTLNLSDPDIMLTGDMVLDPSYSLQDPRMKDVFVPSEDCFLHEYLEAYPILVKLSRGNLLSEEEMDAVQSLDEPLLKEYLAYLDENLRATLADMPESVRTVPDVPADEVLDAILANYAGKPVMVDIWATWCAPCRAGHKMLEPMKADKYKDVTFVYLTNPSSPKSQWMRMIPEITGEHYYLSNEQMEAVMAGLNSNAVPTYLMVSRDGKKTGPIIGMDSKVILSTLDSIK